MKHKETVSIQMDEILPLIKEHIINNLNLPKNIKLNYTSKTKFLIFDIER